MYKRILPLLVPLLASGSACDSKKSFEQVKISGLKICEGGIYQQPLMMLLTGVDSKAQITITNGDDTITMRKDKKASYRVRVGVCQNPLDESHRYTCTEPNEWYFDQRFTYDSKAPTVLEIPEPATGLTCVKL